MAQFAYFHETQEKTLWILHPFDRLFNKCDTKQYINVYCQYKANNIFSFPKQVSLFPGNQTHDLDPTPLNGKRCCKLTTILWINVISMLCPVTIKCFY